MINFRSLFLVLGLQLINITLPLAGAEPLDGAKQTDEQAISDELSNREPASNEGKQIRKEAAKLSKAYRTEQKNEKTKYIAQQKISKKDLKRSAEKAFNSAIENEKAGDQATPFNKGLAKDLYQRSIEGFEKAEKDYEKHGQIHKNISDAYGAIGNKKKAQHHLDKSNDSRATYNFGDRVITEAETNNTHLEPHGRAAKIQWDKVRVKNKLFDLNSEDRPSNPGTK